MRRRNDPPADLLHPFTADELAGAVRAVQAGLLVLHPEALALSMARDTTVASAAPLTSREREILEMMADGMHNRTIAARLGIYDKLLRDLLEYPHEKVLNKLGIV